MKKMSNKIVLEVELDLNSIDAQCINEECEESHEIIIGKCIVRSDASDSDSE